MVDDADRENEGDLIVAADAVTEQQVGFMIRHTSGIICLPMLGERLDDLRLPMMVTVNTDVRRTAFTISIDAREGTTTGISAADRVRTIRAAIDPATRHDDLNRPGHIFPLRLRVGWRIAAGRAHRGGGGLGHHGRSLPGGGARRGDQRRRHRRPAGRHRDLRQAARHPHRHHRRPHRLPQASRATGGAGGRGSAPHPVR